MIPKAHHALAQILIDELGPLAETHALSRVTQMRDEGNEEGAEAWTAVAGAVRDIEAGRLRERTP
jgi:hypothetical protein